MKKNFVVSRKSEIASTQKCTCAQHVSSSETQKKIYAKVLKLCINTFVCVRIASEKKIRHISVKILCFLARMTGMVRNRCYIRVLEAE